MQTCTDEARRFPQMMARNVRERGPRGLLRTAGS